MTLGRLKIKENDLGCTKEFFIISLVILGVVMLIYAIASAINDTGNGLSVSLNPFRHYNIALISGILLVIGNLITFLIVFDFSIIEKKAVENKIPENVGINDLK